MWSSFPFNCRLLFISSSKKISIFTPFLSIRVVLDSFCRLIFYSEKFSTWMWRLPFAVNVHLNLSNIFGFVRIALLRSIYLASYTGVGGRSKFCRSGLTWNAFYVSAEWWRSESMLGGWPASFFRGVETATLSVEGIVWPASTVCI